MFVAFVAETGTVTCVAEDVGLIRVEISATDPVADISTRISPTSTSRNISNRSC